MDASPPTTLSRRLALAGLGAAGFGLLFGPPAHTLARQEGSSTNGAGIAMEEVAPGIARELFAAVPTARAAGQTLYQARFTFNPGAEIYPHSHPGSVLLCVSSGAFGWTLVEGVAHVVRGSASGEEVATEDLGTPGDEVVLEPGDAIYYEDDVVHTARGAGDEPAIVLGTLLLTAGEPFLMQMAMGSEPVGAGIDTDCRVLGTCPGPGVTP